VTERSKALYLVPELPVAARTKAPIALSILAMLIDGIDPDRFSGFISPNRFPASRQHPLFNFPKCGCCVFTQKKKKKKKITCQSDSSRMKVKRRVSPPPFITDSRVLIHSIFEVSP
jgi:hypothetical protein